MTHKDDVASVIPDKKKYVHVGSEVYTMDNNNFYVVPIGIDGEYNNRVGNNFYSYYNTMFEKPIQDVEEEVYAVALIA